MSWYLNILKPVLVFLSSQIITEVVKRIAKDENKNSIPDIVEVLIIKLPIELKNLIIGSYKEIKETVWTNICQIPQIEATEEEQEKKEIFDESVEEMIEKIRNVNLPGED